MSDSEYDEIKRAIEGAAGEIERARVKDEVPDEERKAERAQALKMLTDALERLRELERGHRRDSELAEALRQMSQGTKQLLAAINANTKTTNELLAISNARVTQLEQEIVSGNNHTAFPADPNVLAEGEFLKAQLGGIQSTEDPRPLFKDAVPAVIPGGLDVLSAAVCASCPDDGGGTE